MKSFLQYVAEDIVRRYGTDLSRTVVVFPNKRASLFLNEHLARQTDDGHPLWSPTYITISDLFRQQSSLLVADPIKLVCDLHQSFCAQSGSEESLDKFYSWGQLLLADFDDIDKNMADPDRVFANLRDIHELDDLSFLSDEQRQLLQHFFSHFTEEHETELKQRFLRLWSRMADIYHDFNERLSAQGLAYEGALYRRVCTDISTTDWPYDRYLFVGFNLLQKVERQLFSALMKEGKAHFYWDFDDYYMKEGHEAGRYISQYLQYFPNELDTSDETIYHNFQRPKQVTYLSASTENIQARYLSTWLREQRRYADGRRTAIVLCDESLLPTVIHCLPDEVEKVNVTTGYPLALTPVASFIQRYYDLLVGGRTPRLLRAFKRHPYHQYVEAYDDRQPTLRDMLRDIAKNASTTDPLFQESLFRAYTLINRLDGLVESGDLQVTDVTMQRLIGQLMQQTSIPFHGEPVEGIQIMGVLETRNLDFDHVLLLSCNEGNMPRGVNDSSFIPHSIRQAYELTTVENKVGIYAYYFHRLLQRAQDVTILWNNSTEDGQRGEMSRFMLQMLVESGFSISQHTLQSGKPADRWTPIPIGKTAHMMQLLQSQFTPPVSRFLTPTAINKYLRCPIQFYYRYVGGIKEPDTPDDEQELDNRIFGNIFHEAADAIYHQLPSYITRDVLEQALKNKALIERAVDEAFQQELPHAPKGGLHIINREVIIRYLRQLITLDRERTPFTMLGLECDVEREFCGMKIGGRIDRLDQQKDGTIRVVDYKTGSQKLTPLASVEDIFNPEKIQKHSDYYLQTFVYADIVRRQHDKPVVPALLFIQHASKDDYNPVLRFGKEEIRDIADYSQDFNALLEEKVKEIFSTDKPFRPTEDLNICRTCPYRQMCRQS